MQRYERSSGNDRAAYEALYGVGWGELPRDTPRTANGRPSASGAQRGASAQRALARPTRVRLVVASPASPAGRRQMARRRRLQAIRVYRHARMRQIGGLAIVLALGVGGLAEGFGLWDLGRWLWQWAGL